MACWLLVYVLLPVWISVFFYQIAILSFVCLFDFLSSWMVLRLFVCLSGSLVICLLGSRIICVSGWFFVCLVGCLVCLSVWFRFVCWNGVRLRGYLCQSIWKVIDLFFCLTFVCVFRFFLRSFVCLSVRQSACLISLSDWMVLFVCLSVSVCFLCPFEWFCLSVCLCLIRYLCVCLSVCSPVYFQEWRPCFSVLYLSVIPIIILILRISFYYFY